MPLDVHRASRATASGELTSLPLPSETVAYELFDDLSTPAFDPGRWMVDAQDNAFISLRNGAAHLEAPVQRRRTREHPVPATTSALTQRGATTPFTTTFKHPVAVPSGFAVLGRPYEMTIHQSGKPFHATVDDIAVDYAE